MRKQMFLALALAAVGGFSLASCGGGSNNNSDMGPDMAGSALADMALPKLNCLGIGNCVLQCVINTTNTIDACFMTCSKQGKTGSANKWLLGFTCGQDYCAPPSDMIGKCVSVTNPANKDDVRLCDPGFTFDQCTTQPSTVCLPCIANARNLIFGDFSADPNNPGPPTGMCPDPTSPDCKGGAMCTPKINACIMDL